MLYYNISTEPAVKRQNLKHHLSLVCVVGILVCGCPVCSFAQAAEDVAASQSPDAALSAATSGSQQPLHILIDKYRQQARNDFSPQTGTSAYTVDNQAIDALPQGADTPLDKIMLQMPGVAEDSAAS